MLHHHVDVIGSDTILRLGRLIGGSGSLLRVFMSMIVIVLMGSSSSMSSLVSSGHLGGLSLLKALVGVVVFKFTEANELVTVVTGDENLGVVDHENESVSLLDGDAGDSAESLHTKFGESLAALLLASVELGSFCY